MLVHWDRRLHSNRGSVWRAGVDERWRDEMACWKGDQRGRRTHPAEDGMGQVNVATEAIGVEFVNELFHYPSWSGDGFIRTSESRHRDLEVGEVPGRGSSPEKWHTRHVPLKYRGRETLSSQPWSEPILGQPTKWYQRNINLLLYPMRGSRCSFRAFVQVLYGRDQMFRTLSLERPSRSRHRCPIVAFVMLMCSR